MGLPYSVAVAANTAPFVQSSYSSNQLVISLTACGYPPM